MTALASFPPPIRRYLGRFVSATRRLRLLRALLLGLCTFLTWTLVVALIDRLVALPGWLRAALGVAQLLTAASVLARPARDLLRRRVDWVRASEALERRDAALGQRLVTVTSQLLAPPALRGSPQMLDALVAQVSADVAASAAGRHLDWRALARPAAALLAVVLATAALVPLAWLNLPQLLARQLRPLADIPPVSTTQIDLAPGDVTVKEREVVVVRAVVRHIAGGAPPTLYVAATGDDAGAAFEPAPMAPAADADAFTFALPPADRDLRYYVKAGDATTPTRHVRVLRRPAVAEFRVRYNYPPYTGRAALTVNGPAPLIEAPHGTEAVVNVVATEPLAAATIKVGGRTVDLAPTAEPNVRQAHLTVTKDERCELDLTSDRGVPAKGPVVLQVRGVPDRAPLVRLLQPATDLRLTTRDIVPIAYQAMDDYGVAGVSVRAQVNANPPVDYPLKVRGDARRVDATFDLDLAALKLKVGDVVSITVAAADRAKLVATSDVRHVLISPRAVDVTTHLRLAELAQAADYARAWADQLDKARQEVDLAKRGDADRSAHTARAARALTTAGETANLARQSLLRAVMYSASPAMSDALAQAVDAASAQLDNADRVEEALASRRDVDDATAARAARVAAAARELAAQVKTLADGDQAAALLADRAALKSLPTTAPADRAAQERRKQMLDRARQDLNATLAVLDINPKSASIDAHLQERVAAAARLIAAARPVDFDAAARRWASGVSSGEAQPPRLDDRLASASQAQGLRPDAELVAAHDLQLAARAAAALAEPVRVSAPGDGAAPAPAAADEAARKQGLSEFPAALAALRAEHEVNRRALAAATLTEARKVHAAARPVHEAATAARAKVSGWAAGPGAGADQLAARAREAEELALAANAATQSREFDRAAEMDKRLAAALNRPEIADATRAPRAIDRLSVDQERVADDTAAASSASAAAPDAARAAAAIAGVQRQVADDIDRAQADAPAAPTSPDSTEARQRSTEAISRAGERLAALPMQLSTAEELAAVTAESAARLAAAKAENAGATPAQREAADRVLSMVQIEADDARRNFAAAVRSFRGGKMAEELADDLRPFAPDTANAVAAIEDELKTALIELDQALGRAAEPGGDRAPLARAAQQVRDAAAGAQEALRDAKSKSDDRNPLVAAKWYARHATDALTLSPPDLRAAAVHQRHTMEAFGKATIDANRRAKGLRLSHVPTYAPIYAPPIPNPWADADPTRPGGAGTGGNADRLLQTLPGLREWGRLRERMSDSLDAPLRESEPPGYAESLKTYFEVLGKEDSKK